MKSAVHEIWKNDISDLQARIRLKAYPPRITATVSGESAFKNGTETVSFEGALEGNLSRGVHFVLPQDHVGESDKCTHCGTTCRSPVKKSPLCCQAFYHILNTHMQITTKRD